MSSGASQQDIQALQRVRDAIAAGGFGDYFFVGITLEDKRLSAYCIGADPGQDNGFANCARWDRLVGAIQRHLIKWEIEASGPDPDVEMPEGEAS